MKQTEKLRINQEAGNIQTAIEAADAFIKESGLTGKQAIHLRLLVEETLGMVQAMTGDFSADFWLESGGEQYKVCLTAKTPMNKSKKSDLLSVSSSGRNASARGFMGKISEIIEDSLLNFDDVMTIHDESDLVVAGYNYLGPDMPGAFSRGQSPMMKEQLVWSLHNYRNALDEAPDSDSEAMQAWDELEKSIVASIASDVIVGIRKDRVDMTIVMDGRSGKRAKRAKAK